MIVKKGFRTGTLSGFFFDKILTETERQFFAKLRNIAETEKYEIFRCLKFRNPFSKAPFFTKIGVFTDIFMSIKVFLTVFHPFMALLSQKLKFYSKFH